MPLSKPRRVDADRLIRLVHGDAESGDRCPGSDELRYICRGGDEDLGQVHNADRASVLIVAPPLSPRRGA